MGDSSETLSSKVKLSEMRNKIKLMPEYCSCVRILGGQRLDLDLCGDSIPWILNHVDCFVRQSRGNKNVTQVHLTIYSLVGQDDEAWDKFGQAIGNLQALGRLCLDNRNFHDADDHVVDWEILARILSHIRQKVRVDFLDDTDMWAVEEAQAVARAIRGHPTITSFDSCIRFPHEASDALYSALATLPALESVTLCAPLEDETTLARHESLTELLRAPSLRSVCFSQFYFTRSLCQATANAIMEGTAIDNLEFWNCSFSRGCAAMMTNGLARNASVISLTVASKAGEALHEVLAAALPLNSTLKILSFEVHPSNDFPRSHVNWSPIFLALEKNTGLKILTVDGFGSMDETLCTAMKKGLGLNKTLETLELSKAVLRDDNAALWCKALSFLRTNKALKSLGVEMQPGVGESCLSAFRINIVAMLQENTSLESLFIRSWNSINTKIKAEEYIALITALQHNTALKSLKFYGYGRLQLTADEDKRMAALLKKNYALASLQNINLEKRAGDVGAILQLNAAGRRYLIEDGSSFSKGVKVLSTVRSDINCVFLHLLENPRLCDRSAVEVASDRTEERSRRGLGNPANHNGKREQGQALEEGKESRRRRT